MTSSRWQVVERLYQLAVQRPEAERAAFLERACAGDDELQREVALLLEAPDMAAAFLSDSGILSRLSGGATKAVTATKTQGWIGRRVGAFTISSQIGAGGMGEVYRARDSKLGREVALKILPPALAAHADRLARFTREARLLARINHPNIATIHGVEEADGVPALVLELIEGPTLADRIAQGPLPMSEALAVAKQIASALDAAHASRVVHRDLKPANIKLTKDGHAKVLDFGLARLARDDGETHESGDVSITSTEVRAQTMMGTPAYMSPEQVRGESVDTRTDVWAFGCVLYEMLTGQVLFKGRTVTEILHRVLTYQPTWEELPDATPDAIRQLLRRCLHKDKGRRLSQISDALAIEADGTGRPAGAADTGRRSWWPFAAAGAMAMAAAASIVAWVVARGAQSADERAAIRFTIGPAEGQEFSREFFHVSADGRMLAWVARRSDGGTGSLFVRALSSPDAHELPGTEGATFPFWSPDGRSLGFFTNGELKRVDVAGGAPRMLAKTPAVALGGTWGSQDVIVYSAQSALFRIAAAGGAPEELVRIDRSRKEDSLRFPRFLPDGKTFLYVARSASAENTAAYLAGLDRAPVRLFATLSQVEFSPPGYLLHTQNGALVAQSFDPATLDVGAEKRAIVDGVGMSPTSVQSAFTVSSNGVLLYQGPNDSAGAFQFFNRSGRARSASMPPAPSAQFRLEPNGRRLVASMDDDGDGRNSLWLFGTTDQSRSRLTSAGTHDRDPVWFADGSTIMFSSSRSGPYAIYSKPADGMMPEVVRFESANDMWPEDLSSDSKFLAYRRGTATTGTDVIVNPLGGRGAPIEIAQSPANEFGARFSPDGRWIAYASQETGRTEVYVQPFPPTGAKWQISTDGGREPAWAAGGREMLYLRADGMLIGLTVNGSGPTFSVDSPRPLFMAGANEDAFTTRYDVSSDGQSFMVLVPMKKAAQPYSVFVNWPSALAGAR